MDEKLLTIVNTVLENADLEPVTELRDGQDLRNDLGLDSLSLAELTVRLEEAFGVDIFRDQLVRTVGEVRTILQTAA